ncbi:MAG: tol-pal system-associated acyl-CoA thioesterase [Chromatiales bacterium]
MSEEFIWPVRVYYEDTDAGGVVYYANYLRFMERARTEWLRSLGFDQDRVREEDGVLFAVRRVEVDYLSPARFNDALETSLRLSGRRGASLTFDQEIRAVPGGEVLVRGRVKVACLDAERLRPAAIPRRIAAEIPDVE